MIFLTLLGLVALTSLALFMKWRQGRKHLYELAEKFPTVPGVPLLGNSLMVLMSHNKIVDTLYKFSFEEKFSDCGAAWLGPKFAVILVNPRDIELILGSQTHLKKSDDYRFFQPWFGNGLLISDGDTWRTHRKMIAPTFHLSVLKRFMEEFDLSSKRVISRMRKEGGKTFDCHDYMSECTVETLMETVMGVKQPTEGRNCFDYAMAVMKMCDILHTRQLTLWLRPDSLFRFSDLATKHNVLLKVILNMSNRVFKKKKASFQKKETDNKSFQKDDVTNEKIRDVPTNEKFSYGQMSGLKDDLDVDDNENETGGKKRLPFLESMIDKAEHGEGGLTDQDIINQISTLMFEGHDTTAAGSSFFLCVMGAHQDIQDKVIEEIDGIFGDSDRPVTFQDTLEMKYLERCIMETLRLFPPVPVIARVVEEDVPLVSCNLTIPASTTVIIGTFKLHRRHDTYPDPEVFNPDNFLPEKSVNRHYYSFIPFSAGPRSCVGRKYAMLKLKIILANILREFRVKPGKPIKEWKLQADIILKRSDGFDIALEPRKKIACQ